MADKTEFGTQFEASLGDRGLFWAPRTPFWTIVGPFGGHSAQYLARAVAQRGHLGCPGGAPGCLWERKVVAGANPPSLFAVLFMLP